jgi:hypothetical protein
MQQNRCSLAEEKPEKSGEGLILRGKNVRKGTIVRDFIVPAM